MISVFVCWSLNYSSVCKEVIITLTCRLVSALMEFWGREGGVSIYYCSMQSLFSNTQKLYCYCLQSWISYVQKMYSYLCVSITAGRMCVSHFNYRLCCNIFFSCFRLIISSLDSDLWPHNFYISSVCALSLPIEMIRHFLKMNVNDGYQFW